MLPQKARHGLDKPVIGAPPEVVDAGEDDDRHVVAQLGTVLRKQSTVAVLIPVARHDQDRGAQIELNLPPM